jgi:hypothetical protein
MFLRLLPLLLFSALLAWGQSSSPIPECSSPWLPLQTGNYWIYSMDTRFVTRLHHTLRVLGPYEQAGKIYCQLEDRNGDSLSHRFLRVDAQGRIYQLNTLSADAETLLLDPSHAQDATYEGPLGLDGRFILFNGVNPFIRARYEYASGVGMLSLTESIIAGSSGGFSRSETLLEAKIGDRVYRAPLSSDPQVSLSTDATFGNCAIPCYYAACGLGSPVDPPRTIKPCLRVRMQVSHAPPGANLILDLSSTNSLYQTRIPLASADGVTFSSLPFYQQERVGAALQLFESGEYTITLGLEDASGKLLTGHAVRKTFTRP